MNYYKISESWYYFTPNRDDNGVIEDFDSYMNRFSKCLSHIPDEVIKQWFLPLHNNEISLKHFAWINYDLDKIEFCLEEWENEKIQSINITEDGLDYYTHLSKHETWESFHNTVSYSDENISYWRNHGTWEVPPIVLDCKSFSKKPSDINLKGEYLLVEGHTRTGYLNSFINMKKIGEFELIRQVHKIWVVKYKKSK